MKASWRKYPTSRNVLRQRKVNNKTKKYTQRYKTFSCKDRIYKNKWHSSEKAIIYLFPNAGYWLRKISHWKKMPSLMPIRSSKVRSKLNILKISLHKLNCSCGSQRGKCKKRTFLWINWDKTMINYPNKSKKETIW